MARRLDPERTLLALQLRPRSGPRRCLSLPFFRLLFETESFLLGIIDDTDIEPASRPPGVAPIGQAQALDVIRIDLRDEAAGLVQKLFMLDGIGNVDGGENRE